MQDDLGKDLPLLLDTKMRRNIFYTMLDGFSCISNAVRKAVIDLKLQSSVTLSDQEIEQIRTVAKVLEVVKLTIEVFCRHHATVLTTYATLLFMLTNLKAENINLIRIRKYESRSRNRCFPTYTPL